ncbi:MAG: hypothetical protein HY872_00570 [Chloroflexi bacterium]|nr:hypothetical protein [Chloroflexota bacterium]MBI3176838.1 hypothetical protein [Chloroflexota bacterium]MBI4315017.1 hypothetical protein [Chloroflexota bacterium]MBI5290354.1 hypothetical protein [Chloroflexota bacterium]
MNTPESKDNLRRVLAWLDKIGAVSPSRLAAETQMLPQETWGLLNQLSEMGLVIIRDDPDSADGALVIPAPMSMKSLEEKLAGKKDDMLKQTRGE